MADTITIAFKRPKNGGLLLAQQQSTEAHNCLRAPVSMLWSSEAPLSV